jgi:hypothetical protein
MGSIVTGIPTSNPCQLNTTTRTQMCDYSESKCNKKCFQSCGMCAGVYKQKLLKT